MDYRHILAPEGIAGMNIYDIHACDALGGQYYPNIDCIRAGNTQRYCLEVQGQYAIFFRQYLCVFPANAVNICFIISYKTWVDEEHISRFCKNNGLMKSVFPGF